jgi:hypothetical protein
MKGTLGTNKRKEKDSHPDYSGRCEIDGVKYWISGWKKQNGQTGEVFLSLSFKEQDQQSSARPAARDGFAEMDAAKPKPRPASSGFDGMDDDIPF